MDFINSLLGQLAGNVDIQNLAEKIGLSPEQVESAVQALGLAHPQPGDTVELAAANTGLPTDKLQEIVGHIGGEGLARPVRQPAQCRGRRRRPWRDAGRARLQLSRQQGVTI